MTRKHKTKLLIGIAFIVVLCGAYFGVLSYTKSQEKKQLQAEEEETAQAIVFSVAEDQISRLSFTGDEGELEFVREDGVWSYPGDASFEMDETRIGLLINDLAALSATRTLEDVSELSEYGLDNPSNCITVTLTDGTTSALYVGDVNTSNSETYFQTEEGSRTVYLTGTALQSHFSGRLQDFALYEDCPKIEASAMRIFDVQKSEDSYVLTMPGDDTCTVTDSEGNSQLANLNIVGTLQDNLSNISWLKNLEYNCQDFSVYGLDAPTAVIDITYEKTVTSADTEIGEEAKDETLMKNVRLSIGGQDDNGNYYVRLNDSPQVHSIRGEYLLDFVESKATTFWRLTYSFVSIGDLDYLEVDYGGETHTLQRISEGGSQVDEDLTWMVDGKEVEKELFTDFYYACVSVTAQERLDEVPAEPGEPVLTLRYYLVDGTEKDIVYYAYDQNFYTVLYENGTKAAYTNKLYVNTMIEALDELLAEL